MFSCLPQYSWLVLLVVNFSHEEKPHLHFLFLFLSQQDRQRWTEIEAERNGLKEENERGEERGGGALLCYLQTETVPSTKIPFLSSWLWSVLCDSLWLFRVIFVWTGSVKEPLSANVMNWNWSYNICNCFVFTGLPFYSTNPKLHIVSTYKYKCTVVFLQN